MKVEEVLTDPGTAEALRLFAERGEEALLLGRELGGAVIVTAAAPLPADEESWERLRGLRHGPVGRLRLSGGLPPPGDPFLPGDVILLAARGTDPSSWPAHALGWTGPGDACRWVAVPFSPAG